MLDVVERRYPLSNEFFNLAIAEAAKASLLSPLVFKEQHNIKLKPGFKTACWLFRPPHEIVVGTDLFEKPNVKKGLTDSQQKKYIANHYHHELGHARFTERNLTLVNQNLKKFGCPFQLFNLFEDANMEYRYAKEANYCFDWLSLESLSFNARPESLMLALIQAEGALNLVQSELERPIAVNGLPDEVKRALIAHLPRVYGYYQKILTVTRSMQLMPILKEWLDEFGTQPAEPNQEPSDLELSSALMGNQTLAESFLNGTKPVSLSPQPPAEKPKVDDNKISLVKKGAVLGCPVPVDLVKAQTFADMLTRAFESYSSYSSTSVPQKRISIRNHMLGLPIYRRRDVTSLAPKKIFFLFDCSGSMHGKPVKAGKLLVSALNMLARKGLVSGVLALSAINEKKEACHEIYAFPVAQEVIDRIEAGGIGEGLASALSENMALAQAADHVMVYTDGQIGDIPMNKPMLHQHNIETWGVYVGSVQDCLEELLLHFDKVLVRSSIEAIIDAIILQLK